MPVVRSHVSQRRAAWLARVAMVAVGLVVVAALLSLQPRSLGLADEPPPGAARLGAAFLGAGPEPPDGRRAALEDDDGMVDGAEDADEEEGERRVAFSLSRVASLLGWGPEHDDDVDSLEDADPDRIRLSDLKPLPKLHGAGQGVVGASTDWADSALLRAFMARFGAPRTAAAPRAFQTTANLEDGEMQDLVSTPGPPAAEQARSARPDVGSSPPLPELQQLQQLQQPLPACPLNGVILTQAAEGAGAGARVFEYAAAWLVARGVGNNWRAPLVPGVVLRDLSVLFAPSSLSLAAVEQLPAACRLDARFNWTAALEQDDFLDVKALPARFPDPRVPLVVHSGVLLPHLLAAHLPALRQELVLRSELTLAGRAVLEVCRQQLQQADGGATTLGDGDGDDGHVSDAAAVRFIAVHARRDDAAPWLRRRRRRLSAEYFRTAMDHFRPKGDQAAVVFVVTSDDPRWVRNNLAAGDDVCLTGSDPVDLAVLATCDGAVLDFSDTALAMAVLAAKDVVAPAALRTAAPGLAALPGWTFV